jgi:TonB-linked SusC/RagA family outer membrane protein
MRTLRWLVAIAIAVALAPEAIMAQQPAQITGRVTGDVGQPLGSVQVFIPSLNIGTLSRADGNFTLTVPAGRFTPGESVEVQASMVGFRRATTSVALQPGTVTLNFEMGIDPLRLEEIVVTGAGLTARAERLGTARSTVTDEQVVRASESNIITALAAKSPNLITTNSGGDPGTSTAIRIRGTSTLAGTGQPTIIVDGMPINNATRVPGLRGAGGSELQGPAYGNRAIDINPDDIESIEILKGPSAMSILGASAGASGAILITTKRGRPGVTRYSFRSEMQLDRPVNHLPVQQRFTSGTGGEATPCLAAPTPGCFHNNSNWGPLIPAGTPVFDHGRELFGTGRMFDNTLTMSGGTEATTFYLSFGALNHNGFVEGDSDQFQRYTTRLNATHELRNNLQVGGNIAYAQTEGSFIDRGNTTNGIMLPAFRAPPDFNHREYLDPEFGLHRSYRFPRPRAQDLVADRGWDNPFFAIENNPHDQWTGRVYGNVTASWQALPWLQVNYALGADYSSDDRSEAMHVSASGGQSGGQLSRHQFFERIIDHTLTATATWTLNPEIGGTFSVGQNLNEEYMRQIYVRGNTFIAPFPYKLENTVTRQLPSDREYRRRLAGHYAQAEVDYAEQLFLTGRVRVDGSSTFGRDNQFATYPGGQVAWVFTRTLDLPEDIITFGRLRLAYGQSGQEPELYQLDDTFEGTLLTDFNPGARMLPSLGGFGGLYSSAELGNPNIKPERVGELDAGFDLSFLDGRFDLGVTYYLSNARDVIFDVDVPPSTGATSVVLNAAEIENRGWEVTFNTRAVQTPDFGLNVGLNWARNRNEVLSLGNIGVDEQGNPIPRELTSFSTSFTGLGQTFAEVGQPVGIMRGTSFVRCGLSPATVGSLNVEQACQGQPHGAVYIGDTGFPVTDPNTRILGDMNPDWTGGLNAEAVFRGIRLSAFLEHRQGGNTFNMTRGSMRQFGTHLDTDIRDQAARPWIEWLDHASILGTAFGPGANTPVQLGQTWFTGWTTQQDLLVEDATHTRLRELSLAYTFTQPWVTQTLGLSGVDVRVTGRNLALWTDYTGYDPDIHLGGAALGNRGIDWWVLPTARSWVFSVGLTR